VGLFTQEELLRLSGFFPSDTPLKLLYSKGLRAVKLVFYLHEGWFESHTLPHAQEVCPSVRLKQNHFWQIQSLKV